MPLGRRVCQGTLERLLDRISIHNTFFPESKLEITGFGLKDDSDDNRGFSIILKQKLIKGKNAKNTQDILAYLTNSGLHPVNPSSWRFTNSTNEVLISDLHDQNIIQTNKGTIILYDCEAELNTNPKNSGKYIIPEVSGNAESVKAIDNILLDICPRTYSIKEVMQSSPKAASHLLANKKFEGTIYLPFDGKRTKMIIGYSKNGELLAVKSSTVMLMTNNKGISPNDKVILASGKPIIKGNKKFFFDIEKGRLNSIIEKKLNLKLETPKNVKPKI